MARKTQTSVPTRLVMFDIDGTLTDTSEVDESCYPKALFEAFGFRDVNTDWSTYKNPTDRGILEEVFRSQLGRSISPSEISLFQERFISLLSASHAATPQYIRAVAGAHAMMEKLWGSRLYAVSIASGCWRRAGLLKLSSAGLRCDGVRQMHGNGVVPQYFLSEAFGITATGKLKRPPRGGTRPTTLFDFCKGLYPHRHRWALF